MKCTYPDCMNEATYQTVIDKTLPTGSYRCEACKNRQPLDTGRVTYERLDPKMNGRYVHALVIHDTARHKIFRFAEYKVTFDRLCETAQHVGVLMATAQHVDDAVLVRVFHVEGADLSFVWDIFR